MSRTSKRHRLPNTHLVIASQLERAARHLVSRLAELDERLERADAGAWNDFLATTNALATVLANLSSDRHGGLLSTAEMARRLNVAPKTLLRRKARGEIRPALQRGKWIRWRGDEWTAKS
jgi:hypothetical protein